jgi:siroheme synthase (precorrin-2 oxidase/ferrochelatase)
LCNAASINFRIINQFYQETDQTQEKCFSLKMTSKEKIVEFTKKSRGSRDKREDKWDKDFMESSMNEPGLSLEEKLQTLQERVKEVILVHFASFCKG